MSTKDLRDLFVYQSALAISGEKFGGSMLDQFASHAKDRGLAELLHDEAKHRREYLASFESCFDLIGRPLETLAPVVEALQTRFQGFAALNRAPEVVDLFIISTVRRFMCLMITTYKELIDLSESLGEKRCGQIFQDLLRHKEEYIERFEQYGHGMAERASITDRLQ
jgi:ferritin-like metal-binding protein YciE